MLLFRTSDEGEKSNIDDRAGTSFREMLFDI